MEKIINKIIDDAINRGTKKREEGIYYPSELAFCLRRNYFLYKKPKEVSLRTLKIFEAGNIFHSWFHNLFENSSIVSLHEKEGSLVFDDNGVQIRGRFDDFILLRVDLNSEIYQQLVSLGIEKYILMEVKTVRNVQFIKKPLMHHAMQLNFYMNRLKLSNALFLYVDRRDMRLKVFRWQYSSKLFERLVDRANKLNHFVINNILPPAEGKNIKVMNWMCRYCHYKSECNEGAQN